MASKALALTYRIGADLGDLERKMKEAGNLTRSASRELRDLRKQQQEHRKAMTQLGVGMLSFGAAAVIGLGMATREAIKWESAFAGVRKTVDGSPEEIAALEGELRNLARTLPSTHQEIAAVAEAAGQLGIKRQDVAAFTRTMIDLGETTNLTAEEAATSLAKFSNIMGTSASDVDRLGAALVALGNDGASTEADIIAMGLRIAGAGKQIGLSESQVLAFASALSSVGIEAEAGGSAFSRVMVDIAAAVNDGSDKLDVFAQIAGMSSTKFAKDFKTAPAQAIQSFVAGLGRMSASGQDVFGVLEQLGLSEIRVRDALLRGAGAADLFSDSLKTGSKAWAENSALAEEAAKRYATSEAQMQMAVNAIRDAAIDVGAVLLPILQGGVEVVRDLVTWFQNLPGPIKTVVTILGAVTGGVTLLGGAALVATPKILAFRESMTAMSATGGKLSGALGKFGLFMAGPWGAGIAAAIGLLGIFAASSGKAQRQQQELADAGKTVAQAIAEQNGVINDSVRADTAKVLAEKGVLQTAKDIGIELPKVTDAVLDQGNAYDALKSKLETVISQKEAELRQSQDRSGKEQERIQGEIDKYQGLLDGINSVRGGKEQELQAQEAAAEGAKDATSANKSNAASIEDVGKAAEKAAEALDQMIDELDRLNGTTLDTREAQRALLEAIDEVGLAIADNGTTLDIHTTAGRKNQEALDGVAQSMLTAAEAAAKDAEANGGAAAGAAALTASLQASRQELFRQAQRFGLTEAQAWAYVDSVLAIPADAVTAVTTPGSEAAKAELKLVLQAVKNIPPEKEVNVGVLSAAAIKALKAVGFEVRTLPDGSVVVKANTKPAQDRLNDYIRNNNGRSLTIHARVAINTAAVNAEVRRLQAGVLAQGGIIHSFASGGFESHQPQIARARPGMVRIWAEPETGTETYIPWAMDRRPRATSILRQTADAFGYALVPRSQLVRFARGGVTGGSSSGGGVVVEQLVVKAFSDQFRLRQVQDELAIHGVA